MLQNRILTSIYDPTLLLDFQKLCRMYHCWLFDLKHFYIFLYNSKNHSKESIEYPCHYHISKYCIENEHHMYDSWKLNHFLSLFIVLINNRRYSNRWYNRIRQWWGVSIIFGSRSKLFDNILLFELAGWLSIHSQRGTNYSLTSHFMKYYDAVLITLIYALDDQRHQVSKHKQLLMWTYIININRCKQKQAVDIDNVHKRNLKKMVVRNVYH